MTHGLERATCTLSTSYGSFQLHGFKEKRNGLEHAALSYGDVAGGPPVLVRLHSECLTGDTFGSCHCDCGPQLDAALKAIVAEGRGALLYLRQEGRGIGLLNKIRAYALQAEGADTFDANRLLGLPVDARDYGVAAQMLQDLGIDSVRLLTNNPDKIANLGQHGIEVADRVPLEVGRNPRNTGYLDTKVHRMGHLFSALTAAATDDEESTAGQEPAGT